MPLCGGGKVNIINTFSICSPLYAVKSNAKVMQTATMSHYLTQCDPSPRPAPLQDKRSSATLAWIIQKTNYIPQAVVMAMDTSW